MNSSMVAISGRAEREGTDCNGNVASYAHDFLGHCLEFFAMGCSILSMKNPNGNMTLSLKEIQGVHISARSNKPHQNLKKNAEDEQCHELDTHELMCGSCQDGLVRGQDLKA